MLKFQKVGKAYTAAIPEGAFWIRRNDAHGWDLICQYKNARNTNNHMARLGQHRTLQQAIDDATALDRN
jgi:hypothetical protein